MATHAVGRGPARPEGPRRAGATVVVGKGGGRPHGDRMDAVVVLMEKAAICSGLNGLSGGLWSAVGAVLRFLCRWLLPVSRFVSTSSYGAFIAENEGFLLIQCISKKSCVILIQGIKKYD